MCAGDGRYSQLQAFRQALCDCSMKCSWARAFSATELTSWTSRVNLAIDRVARVEQESDMHARSSLLQYAQFNLKPERMPVYLDDRSNIEGTRLLTKCRLGHLRLFDSIARDMGWPSVRAQCLLCRYGSIETVQHFLKCPALAICRQKLDRVLRTRLSQLGAPGLSLLSDVLGTQRWRLILGGAPSWGGCPSDLDDDQFRDLCGQAAWTLDKAVKNFLVSSWSLWQSVIWVLTVRNGRLHRVLPAADTAALVQKQTLCKVQSGDARPYRLF